MSARSRRRLQALPGMLATVEHWGGARREVMAADVAGRRPAPGTGEPGHGEELERQRRGPTMSNAALPAFSSTVHGPTSKLSTSHTTTRTATGDDLPVLTHVAELALDISPVQLEERSAAGVVPPPTPHRRHPAVGRGSAREQIRRHLEDESR